MSTRRLVITAVLSGRSQSDVARDYGVSQGWVSRLMSRYAREGEAAFEPRSRRPKTSPMATPPAAVALIVSLRAQLSAAGLDAGLYSIGIGRTHSRTRVIVLIHDLDIRIINAATGEVLRQLTLDPTRRYQPTGQPPGRKQQEPPPK